MSKVYFKRISSYNDTDEINKASLELFSQLLKETPLSEKKDFPIKVTFGEKNNSTFIEPKNFESIINFLKSKEKNPFYIETNVLYKGERMRESTHIKLAKEHGFNQIPIVIADGDIGEAFSEIEIPGGRKCKIGKKFDDYGSYLVLSHFKGHILAGYGGAIKQLAMGFASRGGKLDQHGNSKPIINPLKCKKCKICTQHCPEDAISIGTISKIDKTKCIGCAACIAACPHDAIKINWAAGLINFKKNLADYATAAAKNKNNYYISFALNMTKGCDCEGHKMKPLINDIGIFASDDPVAIDKAAFDKIISLEGKKVFKGDKVLDYAEELNLGSKDYELIEI